MATAEPIDPGFSTADAEYPSLNFSRGELTLTFRDWREDHVRVVFHDVWRFDWLDEVPDGDQISGERWDGASVIHDSDWIPATATDACKTLSPALQRMRRTAGRRLRVFRGGCQNVSSASPNMVFTLRPFGHTLAFCSSRVHLVQFLLI